jgi:hypothetical protein
MQSRLIAISPPLPGTLMIPSRHPVVLTVLEQALFLRCAANTRVGEAHQTDLQCLGVPPF